MTVFENVGKFWKLNSKNNNLVIVENRFTSMSCCHCVVVMSLSLIESVLFIQTFVPVYYIVLYIINFCHVCLISSSFRLRIAV